MSQETILRQIYDYANRANPYPLWAKLRQTPVGFQENGPDEEGTYVVSTYREIEGLLHDPRISSDLRNCAQTGDDHGPQRNRISLSTWTPRSTTACAGWRCAPLVRQSARRTWSSCTLRCCASSARSSLRSGAS